MSRQSPEAVNRYVLQIEGRHGEAEEGNPFTYRSRDPDPPLIARAPYPGFDDLQPLREHVPGSDPPVYTTQRQVVVRGPDGRPQYIRLPPELPGDVAPGWLHQALAERGLEGARLTDIFCEPADPVAAEAEYRLPPSIIRTLVGAMPNAHRDAQEHGVSVHWLTADGGIRNDLRVDFRLDLPLEYPRALAKIAFHYFLKMDTDSTGREEAFAPIRDYIYDGVGDVADFVELNARPFVLDAGVRLRGPHHALFLEIGRDGLVKVRMQFFIKGPYQVGPKRVTLGRDQFIRHLRVGHCIRMFGQQTGGFDGELIQVEPVCVDGLWGVRPPAWAGR
jgi:hypothetical protein